MILTTRIATTCFVWMCLGAPTTIFAQGGLRPADIKKFEESNDLLGFAVAAYRVVSPNVGELVGYFKTYQAATRRAADLLSFEVDGRKIFARVEVSWDFDDYSNVLTVRPDVKSNKIKSTYFSQSKGLLSRLKEAEGESDHLYRDKNGVVTIGFGHNASDREAVKNLPFVRKSDGEAATAAEIEKEWNATRGLPANKTLPFYEGKTALRLDKDTVDSLFRDDVTQAESALQRLFPGYDDFPRAAREGLLDMSFNLGATGLADKFPELVKAVKAKDWSKAAQESHRKGVSDERNDAVQELLNDAATSSGKSVAK
jgi:GH24 family phage-related lysozyme (muramidase)